MTDERYKKIMADLGMPNSRSLLAALQQVANEAGQECAAAEREACAKICDAEADSMEQGAQRAIENGEPDEVSSLRSTAWKLSVAANRIRVRSNAGGKRSDD